MNAPTPLQILVHDVRGAVGTASQALRLVAKDTSDGPQHVAAMAGLRTLTRLLQRAEAVAAMDRLSHEMVEAREGVDVSACILHALEDLNQSSPRFPVRTALPKGVRRHLARGLFAIVLQEFLQLGCRLAHAPLTLTMSEGGGRTIALCLEVPLHPRALTTTVESMTAADTVTTTLLRRWAEHESGQFRMERNDVGTQDPSRPILALHLWFGAHD